MTRRRLMGCLMVSLAGCAYGRLASAQSTTTERLVAQRGRKKQPFTYRPEAVIYTQGLVKEAMRMRTFSRAGLEKLLGVKLQPSRRWPDDPGCFEAELQTGPYRSVEVRGLRADRPRGSWLVILPVREGVSVTSGAFDHDFFDRDGPTMATLHDSDPDVAYSVKREGFAAHVKFGAKDGKLRGLTLVRDKPGKHPSR